MNTKNNILNIFFKKQKWIEALAIFLVFLGISFSFGNKETAWLWEGYPYVAFLISVFAVTLALLWLKLEKAKIQSAINAIHKNADNTKNRDLLTKRQEQVFDLILQNKSNKEISEELFIELSTLKTHINKIYKTLNIKSRKETKQFKN